MNDKLANKYLRNLDNKASQTVIVYNEINIKIMPEIEK